MKPSERSGMTSDRDKAIAALRSTVDLIPRALADDLARELERITDISDASGGAGYHRLCAEHALAKYRNATGLERPPLSGEKS